MKQELRKKYEDILPDEAIETIRIYIEDGCPMGSFLTAVFSNDLFEAYGRADHINKGLIYTYCKYVCNCLPMDCWGSSKIVEKWISIGGLNGNK